MVAAAPHAERHRYGAIGGVHLDRQRSLGIVRGIGMAEANVASGPYAAVEQKLAEDRCVVLDGGVATELQRLLPPATVPREDDLWGTWALYRAPETVAEVHRSYAADGCDVISTDTWSVLADADGAGQAKSGLLHWMDIARTGIRIARTAANEDKARPRAVAFSLSDEAESLGRAGTARLLARIFEDETPDLILLETLSLIREPETFDLVASLVELGLPLWLSYRRCRHGVCGVYGQHWGPPEGDLFGRAATRFEEMGVSALLINCLPVDHVPGMISWLRDFTDMPLGVYPNLGHLTRGRWRFDDRIDPEAYARLALDWREEGAQIVGGCCGVTPAHIAAAATALANTKAGHRRVSPRPDTADGAARRPVESWRDDQGRVIYPLPFPDLAVEPGVFVPTQGSYLLWKHLQRTGIGAGGACLDVGCGCGILAVQLALNGAASVHAIDIDRGSVANTLANAFRNGASGVVSGDTVDLFQWEPTARFDVIAASLYQMPVDPYEEPSGHRPLDFWGRNLLDRFLALLPDLLAPGGKALVLQLSILGQVRTAELLAAHGLAARVVDYSFFPFGKLFEANAEQIARVEELSDAQHLAVGGDNVMIAYLLEIERAG
jgi:S-methylmethionine-dependent homocysteine/selenocysteine methylase/SAM-dependent methyltransferase